MCEVEQLVRVWFKVNIWETHSDLSKRADRKVNGVAWINERGLLMNPFFNSHLNCCLFINCICHSCRNSRNQTLHAKDAYKLYKIFIQWIIGEKMVVSIVIKIFGWVCLMVWNMMFQKAYKFAIIHISNKGFKQKFQK